MVGEETQMKKYTIMIFLLMIAAGVFAWDLAGMSKIEPATDISYGPMCETGVETIISKEVSTDRYSVDCFKAFLIHQHYEAIRAAWEKELASKVYLGNYRLTAYCPCEKCCGVNTGMTASGTRATAGRTIGVNPEDIPYGTIVIIGDKKYVAEDTGGAIGHKHIDIFFNTHEEALAFGVHHEDVYILKEE